MKHDYTPEYNEAWELWPGRWNGKTRKIAKPNKRLGFVQWQQLSQEERDDILVLLKTHKVKDAGTQYLKDFFRWLRDGGFDDFI